MTDVAEVRVYPFLPPDLEAEAQASVALDGETQSETLTEAPTPMSADELVRRLGLAIITNEDGTFSCPVCSLSMGSAQGMGPHFRIHWREAGVHTEDIPSSSDRVACPRPSCTFIHLRTHLTRHLVSVHEMELAEATGVARTAGFTFLPSGTNRALTPAEMHKAKDRDRKRQERSKAGTKPNASLAKQYQIIECPEAGCVAAQRRKNMSRHLVKIHRYSVGKARAFCSSAAPSELNAPRKSEGRGGPPSVTPGSKVPAVIKSKAPAASRSSFEQAATPPLDFTSINPTDIAIGIVQSQVNGTLPTAYLPEIVSYIDHTREVISTLRATRPST